jgi:hypothetical protein
MSSPKIREYPATSHATVTRAIDTKLIMIMFRTPVDLTIPP